MCGRVRIYVSQQRWPSNEQSESHRLLRWAVGVPWGAADGFKAFWASKDSQTRGVSLLAFWALEQFCLHMRSMLHGECSVLLMRLALATFAFGVAAKPAKPHIIFHVNLACKTLFIATSCHSLLGILGRSKIVQTVTVLHSGQAYGCPEEERRTTLFGVDDPGTGMPE